MEEAIQEHLYIFNKVKKNNNQQALSYQQPLFLKVLSQLKGLYLLVSYIDGYIITLILHQIFMTPKKVKLAAG